MGIPEFNQRGVLPRGLHKCSHKEFIRRFCILDGTENSNESISARSFYIEVLEQLFGHSVERGAKSVIFGGSFVTKDEYPNDIDCIVILPNEFCLPNKSEIVILNDCRLDVVYLLEDDKKTVSQMINMFALDYFDLEVGLVEVILDEDFETSWQDFLGGYDLEILLEERKAYIHRHYIVGSEMKGILVTIHGLNTNAEWNFDLAPIASSNNWIFAPFNYGNVRFPLIDQKEKNKIIEHFREWIKNISDKYNAEPSIFAHSFGTYILGQYIKGFNYKPPVKLKNIILAGSILNSEFDWEPGFKNDCYNSVLNIISPNDPVVPHIEKIRWLHEDELYGKAGCDGFIQSHPRLFQDKVNIYDHSSMLRTDVFETKIIPFLNMSKNFEKLWLDRRLISDKSLDKLRKG